MADVAGPPSPELVDTLYCPATGNTVSKLCGIVLLVVEGDALIEAAVTLGEVVLLSDGVHTTVAETEKVTEGVTVEVMVTTGVLVGLLELV